MNTDKLDKLIIASRGSALALWQANWVKSRLEETCRIRAEIRVIKTTGDKHPELSLTRSGTKGLFTKEIEEALLACQADLAVHSFKDLPNDQPRGLTVAAFLEREDARDVLISRDNRPFSELPRNARIGTSSLRRQSQLRDLRPDLKFTNLRGNLDTRLKKVEGGDCDALVVAAAGIHRLGFKDRITEYFSPQQICPAVGQGVIAIEIRENEEEIVQKVRTLDHEGTRITTQAERAFLRKLGGGCQTPIAAYGTLQNGKIHLQGIVADQNGERLMRATADGPAPSPEELGIQLAEDLLAKGAGEFLKDI